MKLNVLHEYDVPADMKDGMEVCFVRTVEEAIEGAFGRGVIRWRRLGGGRSGGGGLFVESRL